MQILIEYHGEMILACVESDYKVTVSSKDVGLEDRIYEISISLDQCRGCGVWRSEDEELYGEGYCSGCCVMCLECEQYKPSDEMCTDNAPALCLICNSGPEK